MMQPLSVSAGDSDENDTNVTANTTTTTAEDGQHDDVKPLDLRIIEVIESIPNRTVRPGRLASDLGISIEDASAELCGLLAAVGGGTDGATFRFEKTGPTTTESSSSISGSVLTMVFTFPPDFKRRALNKRRQDDLAHIVQGLLKIVIKALKIVTAAGLILSLLIVCIVLIAGFVAALVALSRGGGNRRHHSALINQIRHIIILVRQVLWCYALFGPVGPNNEEGTNGQDPFLREVAYDLWLVLSVCCGNPASIFYWIRASELNRRRSRSFRSWGSNSSSSSSTWNNNDTYHGVTVISSQNRWQNESEESSSFLPTTSGGIVGTNEHRGLLSVAVEFLFGPTPFVPGPTKEEIWKLRASYIIEQVTKQKYVALKDMAPYIDNPPNNGSILLNGTTTSSSIIVSQCLSIVSYFNGIPTTTTQTHDEDNTDDKGGVVDNPLEAKFIFPELCAEASVATRYDPGEDDTDDGTWASILYSTTTHSSAGARASPTVRRVQASSTSLSSLPQYLKENRYKFTQLTYQQLVQCVVLGSLNLIGVVWVGQMISPGGVLDFIATIPLWNLFFCRGLYPILRFYAVLFFMLPIGRLIVIIILNSLRKERNRRRINMLTELTSLVQQ